MELNSITLNRSPGASRSSAKVRASLAWRIDGPALAPRAHDRRRDALGIRHAQRACGNVARADDHGKAQREAAAVEAQDLLVLEFHHHDLARADVGHLRGEDVRPLLVEERRAPPG